MAPSLVDDFLNINHSILYSSICESLSTADVLNLALVCKDTAHLRHTLWNINKHLKHFVSDALKFRSLMARCDAVVSGSNALQFFDRSHYPEADLDVYLPKQHLTEFCHYITNNERYAFQPYAWQPDNLHDALVKAKTEGMPLDLWNSHHTGAQGMVVEQFYRVTNVHLIFNFTRNNNDNDDTTKPTRNIQLMTSKCTPITPMITDFYMTGLRQFYTFNRAFSLFPWLTFIRRESLMTQPCDEILQIAVDKYESRGYTIIDRTDAFASSKSCPVRSHRRVGDKYTWTLEFNTDGVDFDDAAIGRSKSYEAYTFSMVEDTPWDDVKPVTEVRAERYTSPNLEYDILCSFTGVWYFELDRRLEEAMKEAEKEGKGNEKFDDRVVKWHDKWVKMNVGTWEVTQLPGRYRDGDLAEALEHMNL